MHRLLVLGLLFLVPAAAGQGVTWEQLRLPPNYGNPILVFDRVAFYPGPTPETDSLFAIGGSRLLRYLPDEEPDERYGLWREPCYTSCAPRTLFVTDAGTLVIGNRDVDRSTDGGRTWERDVNPDIGAARFVQPQAPGTGGARPVVSAAGRNVHRSTGDGAAGTWEKMTSPESTTGGQVVALAEVPPSAALPNGRLLLGVLNGVTVSDDGGATWRPGAGAYVPGRLVGRSFTAVTEPGHPYGGPVFAGVEDLALGDAAATVYRSDDGGATWSFAHRFEPSAYGTDELDWAELVATPDGVLWAGLTHALPGNFQFRPGALARSDDGGVTWAPAQGSYGSHGVNELVVARDGRLYAATVQGVWRTTEPVYAVASGHERPEEGGLGVRVWPSPSAGRATVEVSGLGSEAVRVAVVDALGREVAVLYEGPLGDRERLAVEVGSWAPGVYVVRAVGERGTASATLTVAR